VQEEYGEGIIRAIASLKNLCMKFKWKSPLNTELPIIIDGGETAICNTIEGMEFAVSATGYANPKNVLEAHAEEGDMLIGIASNGIHSNGLTFARDGILGKLKMNLYDKLHFGTTVGEELARSTRIYLEALRKLNEDEELKECITGKVHITGGALSKLRELSKGSVSYEVFDGHVLKPQDIFYFIHERLKVPESKMLTRYNCGIGYVLSIKKEAAEDAVNKLNKYFPADIIGRVKTGNGEIKIHSPFSSNIIKL
jgi:phosphoribosylformylglycinamidine cyclo-ligase